MTLCVHSDVETRNPGLDVTHQTYERHTALELRDPLAETNR